MPRYRLYLLGFDGYFLGATTAACDDDAHAVAEARRLLDTFYAAVEVWEDSRKVGHFEGCASAESGGDQQIPE